MKISDVAMGVASSPENARHNVIMSSLEGDEVTKLERKFSIERICEDIMSEPPKNVTQKERLRWLRQRHYNVHLWVQCDNCDKWRYMVGIFERNQLPKTWYCSLNPDRSIAECSVPEEFIPPQLEIMLIHSEYSAGSLVFARYGGWPWWPGMVDDCPDTEQYYWLEGLSDIPTSYHVTFFHENVTRAWVPASQIIPFKNNMNKVQMLLKNKRYKNKLIPSLEQIEDAAMLDLAERLEKYCFVNRYDESEETPKKVKKSEIKKFDAKMKRKYSIDVGSVNKEGMEISTINGMSPKKGRELPVNTDTVKDVIRWIDNIAGNTDVTMDDANSSASSVMY